MSQNLKNNFFLFELRDMIGPGFGFMRYTMMQQMKQNSDIEVLQALLCLHGM